MKKAGVLASVVVFALGSVVFAQATNTNRVKQAPKGCDIITQASKGTTNYGNTNKKAKSTIVIAQATNKGMTNKKMAPKGCDILAQATNTNKMKQAPRGCDILA